MRRNFLYTIDELYKLEDKPKINEINLKIFKFTVLGPDKQIREIPLRFPQDRLPHLLGIETVAKNGGIPERDLKNFKGQTAYDRIDDDLTFETLKSIHKPTFKSLKDKLIFFYQIPHLIFSTDAVFKFTKVEGSKIECDLFIFSAMHGVYAQYHSLIKN